MSKLEDTLGITPLDEIMGEVENLPTKEPRKRKDGEIMTFEEMTNDEFDGDTSEVYAKAMELANLAADLGANIDPTRAPRMIEVAGQHLKIALDASSSRRDAQLKLMKLVQDQRKLELEEKKVNAELGDESDLKGEIVMVEDRNKLLAQIKAMKSDDGINTKDSEG